ncbi:VOC family protein [Flavobacteriaceae bacterium F89]|uniref:VOC family protein n=1 Tax=Cerina litoralis TaxID=2874477 RepID=A0AAE3ERQ5_9FLAO|nr:VOC family protein [Cerina litoralis]MCG2459168.1 VOC family protein [Cerina litoralis]
MATVNVYLTFEGDCEAAFNFYRSAFGGGFKDFNRFGEMPPQEGMPTPSEEIKNRIMHVSLPISAETILMGSDTMPGMSPNITVGNNFSISLGVNSKEEADKLCDSLSAGGKVTMPLEVTFWGAYFGMWTDKFGINWMVNYDLPK